MATTEQRDVLGIRLDALRRGTGPAASGAALQLAVVARPSRVDSRARLGKS